MGDYCLFIILNADFNSQSIGIPALAGKKWFRAIDTSLPAGSEILDLGHEVPLDPAGYYIANPRIVRSDHAGCADDQQRSFVQPLGRLGLWHDHATGSQYQRGVFLRPTV